MGWFVDSIKEARLLRLAGESDAAIARRFNVTREHVGRTLGRRGDKPPDHPPEFIARADRLWKAGHSITEIGRRMGVTRNVIVGVARRNHFPPRPSPIRRAA